MLVVLLESQASHGAVLEVLVVPRDEVLLEEQVRCGGCACGGVGVAGDHVDVLVGGVVAGAGEARRLEGRFGVVRGQEGGHVELALAGHAGHRGEQPGVAGAQGDGGRAGGGRGRQRRPQGRGQRGQVLRGRADGHWGRARRVPAFLVDGEAHVFADLYDKSKILFNASDMFLHITVFGVPDKRGIDCSHCEMI